MGNKNNMTLVKGNTCLDLEAGMKSIRVCKLVYFATQIAPEETQKTCELCSSYKHNQLGNHNLWQIA